MSEKQLVHFAFFKLQDGFSPDDYEGLIKDICSLEDIPVLKHLVVGRPLFRHSAKGYGLGLIGKFDSEADLEAFEEDPKYLKVLSDWEGKVHDKDTMKISMWGENNKTLAADPTGLRGADAVEEAKRTAAGNPTNKPKLPREKYAGLSKKQPYPQKRLYHVIWLQMMPDFNADDYDDFAKKMLDFDGYLPGLDYLAVGKPVRPDTVGEHTMGLLCEFQTEKDLYHYLEDEEHADMLKQHAMKTYDITKLFWFDFWGENSTTLKDHPETMSGEVAVEQHLSPVEPKPFH